MSLLQITVFATPKVYATPTDQGKNCSSLCIGQTGRSFKSRKNEYFCSFIKKERLYLCKLLYISIRIYN